MTGRIGRLGLLSALALIVILPQTVSATATVAPTNDNRGNASQIAFFPFEDAFVDNTQATLQASEVQPSCASIGATVWYSLTPSSDYSVKIRVTPTTNVDIVLAVYEAYGGDLGEIACADNSAPGSRETLTVNAWGGTTYFIQVGGFASGNTTGLFTVRAKRLPAPANDDFDNAATVALGSVSTVASTFGATIENGEPLCQNNEGKTVWYRYVPGRTRTVIANTFGSDFDTILTVYSGTELGALNGLVCNDDFTTLQSKVKLTVEAGTTYYFQVGGYVGSSGSLSFQLRAK